MYKNGRFITAFLIAGIMLIVTLTACGDKGGPDDTQAPGAAVASAPALASKTKDSITINAVPAPGNGQTVEYAINTGPAAPGSGWQDGLTFIGLQAGTAYYIFARSKANNAYKAGAPSAGLLVTTDDADPSGVTVTGVTVSPETATVGTGQTQQFTATVTGTNNPAQTVTWSLTGGGSGTNVSQGGLLTVADNETAVTLTVKAVSTVDAGKSGTAVVTVTKPVSWPVHDLATWGNAVNGIRSAGNNKAHNITVSGDIAVPVTPLSENTFGSVTGITVQIEGDGTVSPSNGNGSLLRIGAGQTVTVRNLKLLGRVDNDGPVVNVSGGTFRMAGNASVTGNTSDGSGGGVYCYGTFTMQDNATVSGNTSNDSSMNGVAYGGGVYLSGGTFTMKDNASVKDNTVSISYSSYSAYGGGVCIASGNFIIEGGVISGNTASGGDYGSASGGGVYIKDGTPGATFTMKGGTISNNTASGKKTLSDAVRGGGVCSEVNVDGADAFIMEGGTISDNTVIAGNQGNDARGGGVYIKRNIIMKGGTISDNAVSVTSATGNNTFYAQGGGVYVYLGKLTMEDGTISGNTVTISAGANSTLYAQGGGVYTSTLTKTGGTIYGNDASGGLKNTATGGKGHAVYGDSGWRNATAGPEMNTASYGFWLNEAE